MDRQCSSCGGFCKKSRCERENVQPKGWLQKLESKQNKEWLGLTETEKELLWYEAVDGKEHFCSQYGNFADAIEKKLKEKNA